RVMPARRRTTTAYVTATQPSKKCGGAPLSRARENSCERRVQCDAREETAAQRVYHDQAHFLHAFATEGATAQVATKSIQVEETHVGQASRASRSLDGTIHAAAAAFDGENAGGESRYRGPAVLAGSSSFDGGGFSSGAATRRGLWPQPIFRRRA